MSDSPLNGDTRPRGLRAALGIIGAHVKRSIKRRRAGYSRAPRQVCKVCAAMFDFATIAPDATVQVSLCSDCKAKLAEGYTACVTKDAFAFVRSAYLKEHGQAGKIVQVSQETFDQIKKRNDEKKATDEGKTGPI